MPTTRVLPTTIERSIRNVVITTGISSVITQLYTIREFLALFAGNEFVIALVFFNWLILGGLGTLLAHTADRHIRRPSARSLAWLSLAAATLPAIQLIAIRLLRDQIFPPGSEIGFYAIFIYSFLTIAPYCLLIGFVLPYSLFVLRIHSPGYPGGRLYIIDNAGDITGGALFSFVLIFLLTPLQAILAAGLLLMLATFRLFTVSGRPGPSVITGILAAGMLLFAVTVFEKASLAPWFGSLADYRESRYGRLLVQKHQDQYTLFMDGLPMAGSGDGRAAEEAAHYPLAQVDNPGRVLLISAETGILREVSKHRPHTIDYVEIDPAVSKAMFDYGLLHEVPGLNVIHRDARNVLSRPGPVYDAVIACLPEPETFQLNRFYTRTFFCKVRQRLSPEGVFAFSLDGPADYLSESERRKISSVYRTAASCFEEVVLLPGNRLFFLCADRPLDTAIPEILRKKEIRTRYIDSYFEGDVTAGRIARLYDLIDPEAPVNTDTRPVLMRLMLNQWFLLFTASPLPLYIAAALFLGGYLFFSRGNDFILFSTGFTNIATEILIIFAFQIFFGYVYHQIGLIVTVFLAGLLPGAWLSEKLQWRGKRVIMTLDALLIILLGGFIPAVLFGGENLTIAFYLAYGFAVSCVCGFQFPAVLHQAGDRNRQATAAFSADLIGAAFGALVASILLIPWLGLIGTAAALMMLKTVSMGIALRMAGSTPKINPQINSQINSGVNQ